MQTEPQKWVCTNKDCEHFGEDVVAEGATRVYCVSCREDLALQATVPEDSAKAAKPVSDSLLLEDERRIEEREQKATNASFLAHARTDIPLLLSRLKAEREKVRQTMRYAQHSDRCQAKCGIGPECICGLKQLREAIAAAKENHVTEPH